MDKVFPAELADHIFNSVLNSLSNKQKLVLLESGFNVTTLLPFLFDHYASSSFARPERSERTTLADVLAGHPHQFLSLILTIWNGDMDELAARLDLLEEEQYVRFLYTVLPDDLVKHKELLRPQFARVYLDALIMAKSLESKEIVALARDFIEVGAEKELIGFVRLLPALRKKELKTLKKLVSKLTIDTVLLDEIETLLSIEEDKHGGLFNIFRSR